MLASNVTCAVGVCIDVAHELINQTSYNATAVNLCDDFETFVCDGWRHIHQLRPEQSSMSYDNLLQDRSNDVVHAYLEASKPPIDTIDDRKSFALAKAAYDACMNVTEVRREGLSPLTKVLVDIATSFSVNESAYSNLNSRMVRQSDATEVQDVLLYLETVGLSTILDIAVTRDDKDPDVRIVGVQPPSQMTLSKDYYTDNDTMANYTSVMTKVLAAVHPSAEARRNAALLATLVVDYEIRMAAILPDLSDLYDVNKYYTIMSLANTTQLAVIFGLDHVIKSLAPANYSHDRMITSFPDRIEDVAKVFQNTSKEVMQTYFMWRVIDQFVRVILAPEIEPLRVFENMLEGRDPTAFPDRWRTCVSHVSSIQNLGWIITRFYAAEYFSVKGKQLGQQLVTYVRQQYEKIMRTLDWLDDSVKAVAIEKLEKLEGLMGYPDSKPVNVSDPTAVFNFYSDVKITTSYFVNNWNFMARANAISWGKLGTPYDKGEWLMTAQTVNAYNDINSNVIAFPAAILQVPYFNADLPSYMNFGVTGWTVGHEISHAFDNSGRNYDPDGRYGNDWWTNRTDTEFRRLSQCFVEQYGNYSVDGLDGQPLHLNGVQTLGENIADAGGIDTAFLAWQQHRADYPEQDTNLPGLEKWTHEQLYFIAFANSWCSMATKESLVGDVYGDVHSPPKFRVTGTLDNSKYFKEHFNCPSKQPTCKIW